MCAAWYAHRTIAGLSRSRRLAPSRTSPVAAARGARPATLATRVAAAASHCWCAGSHVAAAAEMIPSPGWPVAGLAYRGSRPFKFKESSAGSGKELAAPRGKGGGGS